MSSRLLSFVFRQKFIDISSLVAASIIRTMITLLVEAASTFEMSVKLLPNYPVQHPEESLFTQNLKYHLGY
jgi:hypothetical protein